MKKQLSVTIQVISLIISFSILGYLFFYPKDSGAKLEVKIDNVNENVKDIKNNLRNIEDYIRAIK